MQIGYITAYPVERNIASKPKDLDDLFFDCVNVLTPIRPSHKARR
jgi:hypothetical protein